MLSTSEILILLLMMAIVVILTIAGQLEKANADINAESKRAKDAGEDIVQDIINKRKGQQNG